MIMVLTQFLFAMAGIMAVSVIMASVTPNMTRIMATLRGELHVPSDMPCAASTMPRRTPRRALRPISIRRHMHSSRAA